MCVCVCVYLTYVSRPPASSFVPRKTKFCLCCRCCLFFYCILAIILLSPSPLNYFYILSKCTFSPAWKMLFTTLFISYFLPAASKSIKRNETNVSIIFISLLEVIMLQLVNCSSRTPSVRSLYFFSSGKSTNESNLVTQVSRFLFQVLQGNSNTYIEAKRDLDPPIWASKIRFLPYSEHKRTVCMRVEIYGCYWNGLFSVSNCDLSRGKNPIRHCFLECLHFFQMVSSATPCLRVTYEAPVGNFTTRHTTVIGTENWDEDWDNWQMGKSDRRTSGWDTTTTEKVSIHRVKWT